MKNLFIIAMTLLVLSCSSHTKNPSGTDSMNAIGDNGIQDTAVGPNPDGYAPPNADIDTSKYRKDSIKARDSMNEIKH